MKDGGDFIDNALMYTPDGYDNPIPAFTIEETTDNNDLTFPSITLTEDAVGQVTSLFRMWACFDYVFPDIVERTDEDTIKVEFDILFDEVRGSGESGRLNVTLLQELPDTGITMDEFGVPTYHYWLFNGTYSAALSYGGSYGNEETVNPGWNSGADGIYYNEYLDGSQDLFPNTPNYPEVPYAKDFSGSSKVSQTTWMHITWVIAPQMMHLYYRETGTPPDQDQEIVFMAIPEDDDDIEFINSVHETFAASMPPAYQWFEEINGIRFFYRGATANFNLTNLRVTKTGMPLTTLVEFRSDKETVGEGDGTFDVRIELQNPNANDSTAIDVVLIGGDPAQVGDYETQTVVFPAGSDEEKVITLDILDDDVIATDTLVFELQNIRGGFFPDFGAKQQLELVINDNEASNIENKLLHHFSMYPNPAKDELNVCFGKLVLQQPAELSIYSLNGSIVLKQALHKGIKLDLSKLPNGVYNMDVESGYGRINKRLIISR